jgi:hypothetical protein
VGAPWHVPVWHGGEVAGGAGGAVRPQRDTWRPASGVVILRMPSSSNHHQTPRGLRTRRNGLEEPHT